LGHIDVNSDWISGLSDAEKWCTVQALLTNLLDKEADQELAVCWPTGEALVYLVPPRVRAGLGLNSQMKAELRRRITEDGESIPVADVIVVFGRDSEGTA